VTDHAPHADEEKNVGFRRAPFGIVGLETALGLAVKAMIESGISDWSHLVRWMTTAPACLLGVAGGSLAAETVADIAIIDPNASRQVDTNTFRSKSRNSPFGGWTLPATPVVTMVGGRIAYTRDALEHSIVHHD